MSKKYKILFSAFIIIFVGLCFISRERIALSVANSMVKYGTNNLSIPVYNYILEKNPKNHDARRNLANVYFKEDRGEDGLKLLDIPSDMAGDFYKIYLDGCSYLTQNGEISRAEKLLASAPGQYAKTKIRDHRPNTPQLSPSPGIYDRRVAIASVPKDGQITYVKLEDDEDFSPLKEPIQLDFGTNLVYSVSVDANGIISEINEEIYTLSPPILPVQKFLFTEDDFLPVFKAQ